MIHQLKLTILLLLVASISFAQQNVVNTSKSNVKDFVVADSAKVVPLPTVVKQTKYTTKTKAATNVMIETAKETEKPQAKTAGGPVGGSIVKGGKNPGASMVFNIPTKADGSFETKLEEGSYTISIDAEDLKKTIAALKSKDETINGATFVFDLPANFTFSGTENANKKGEYVAIKYTFEITVPKEGILFAGKLLTSTTAGLSITPTVNERGTGSPKALQVF
jgi:hypothetical protein